jgi:excinuclease ABC subunit A
LTADYLYGRRRVETPRTATPLLPDAGVLRLQGAAEHNLKHIDVEFPLRRLVCVTGVSGSGKSTLVHDILYPALLRDKGKPTENPGRHRALLGAEQIDDVIMVDQSRIGRTTRSIRELCGRLRRDSRLFAQLVRGADAYTPGTFSFNAATGLSGVRNASRHGNAIPLGCACAVRLRRRAIARKCSK